MSRGNAIVRVDSSEATGHLVYCSQCPFRVGPLTDRATAIELKLEHSQEHKRERNAAYYRASVDA